MLSRRSPYDLHTHPRRPRHPRPLPTVATAPPSAVALTARAQPISATVLVIEEISTFFQKSHATHVLVAAVFAFHMVSLWCAPRARRLARVAPEPSPHACLPSVLAPHCSGEGARPLARRWV